MKMQFYYLPLFALLVRSISALHSFTRSTRYPPDLWSAQPYNLDGIAFYAYDLGQQYPSGLGRFFATGNSQSLDYLWTRDILEIEALYAQPGSPWRDDETDILVYSGEGQDLVPLWRSFNGVGHFYSTDENEGPNNGYTIEGVACWVYPYQFGITQPVYRWNLDNPRL